MIRPRVAKHQEVYLHEELPVASPSNFYLRLDEAVGDWRLLAEPFNAAFDEEFGRPTDPVVYLKIFLVGYLENIVWDTDLAERISDSVAIRTFLGYGLAERTPDHSTISAVRARIARDCDVAEVLARVVGLCEAESMVGGQVAAVDASLVPANAGFSSLRGIETGKSIREHLREVRAARAALAADGKASADGAGRRAVAETPATEGVGQTKQAALSCGSSQEERAGEGQETGRQGAKAKKREKVEISNREFRSQTDGDAHIASKPGQLRDLYYRVNHVTDAKRGIILAASASHSSEGEAQSAGPVVSQAAAVLKRNGWEGGLLSADTGYDDADFHAHAEAQGFQPVTNYEADTSKKPEGFKKGAFAYQTENDYYTCPGGCVLHCRSAGKQERRYMSDPADCACCAHREQCLEPAAQSRWLQRHVQEASRERNIARCQTDEGRAALKARKHIVEPPFGHLKAYSGGRVVNCRGIEKANVKAVMWAVAWDLIRLVNCLSGTGGRRKKAAAASMHGLLRSLHGMFGLLCRRIVGHLGYVEHTATA